MFLVDLDSWYVNSYNMFRSTPINRVCKRTINHKLDLDHLYDITEGCRIIPVYS